MKYSAIPGIGFVMIVAGLGLPGTAMAADEETQLWTYAVLQAPLGKTAVAMAEISPRFREDGQLFQARATLDFGIAEGVQLGGGITYVDPPGPREWRPHQQINIALGQLAFRTRLEQRFFDGADRMQLRLRQRVQFRQAVSPRTDLFARAELLYILQDEEAGAGASVDNWRLTLTAEHEIADGLRLGAGYLLMLAPRGAAEARISHVPQVTVHCTL